MQRRRDRLVAATDTTGPAACDTRWCTNRPRVASPFRSRVSDDPDGDRHAEPCHPVEHVAPDLRLGPLIGQSPGVETPTDDGFVSIHPGLGQAPAVVARAALPTHTSRRI